MEKGDIEKSFAQPTVKKKRKLPGNPDPNAEVITLSPRELMATNRFSCEVCGKGFQRDQNLQLHRRGHNLPWKLQKQSKELVGGGGGGGEDEVMKIRKKVYVCPEVTCVHHEPSRALGDLTGIKKHFSRKHGEKNWKCEKCGRKYAVKSDWKAHHRICGTRNYTCDCGIIFSRRDTFVTHRAFCDAFTEANRRGMRHMKSWKQSDEHPSYRPSHSDREVSESALRLEMEEVSEQNRSTSAAAAWSPPLAANQIQDDGRGETSYRSSKGSALSLCLGTGSGSSYNYRPWEPASDLGVLVRSAGHETTYDRERTKTGKNSAAGLGKEDEGEYGFPDLFSAADYGCTLGSTIKCVVDSEKYYCMEKPGVQTGLSMMGSSSTDRSSSVFHSPLPYDTSCSCRISAPNIYLDKLSIQQNRQQKGSGGGGRSCPITLAATTLLQRAVMMGATTNSPYLLRNCGTNYWGVEPPSSIQSAGGGSTATILDSWAGSTYSSEVCHSDQTHQRAPNVVGSGASSLRRWNRGGFIWNNVEENLNVENRRERCRKWDRVGACESSNIRSNGETGGGEEMVEEEDLEEDEEVDRKKTLDFLGVGPPSPSPCDDTGDNVGAKRRTKNKGGFHPIDLNNAIYISSSSSSSSSPSSLSLLSSR